MQRTNPNGARTVSRFTFEYDPLLRLRRHRRDLVRQVLAGVLADLAREEATHHGLETTRERQLDELRRIGAGGAMDVDGAAARRFHVGVLLGEMRRVEARRRTVEGQIELCRRALVEADRDVRVLERLRERRLGEHRAVADRREQHELEETWMAIRVGETAR
jgi:flagellar protein FliJ